MKRLLVIFICLLLTSCYNFNSRVLRNKSYNTIKFAKQQKTFKKSLIKKNKKCWKKRKGVNKRLRTLYDSQRKAR